MRIGAILLAALALTACGGHAQPSAESVARQWSAALNRNDNESAGRLFADGAEIVQNGEETLQTHADAVRWNAGLPCGGRITDVERHGKHEVLAIFQLKERPQHRCDAPGGVAAALFQVEDGKIVLWHQSEVPERFRPSGQTI
jgi:hypothetical protein